MRTQIRRAIVASGAGFVVLALPLVAMATPLTQPNGATIPSPMGCANNEPTGLLAAMACACTQPGICNIGAPCPGGSSTCDDGQHGTCESTIWHSPNDNSCIPSNESGLDPYTQSAITPETFHPTCALSFDVVSRGTAMFQNIFGWYNATTNGSAPPASDLHTMINCGDAAGTTVSLDLASEPAYLGGDVGFFLVTPEDHTAHSTCAGGDCCATVARFQAGQGYAYYSQNQFNPDNTAAAPYIHLLILQSDITTHKFYFAWEDTYDTSSADFTDLVTSVGGVDCSGAGVPCNTGKLGICAQGITTCSGGGTLGCQQLQQPRAQTCDGLDDTCTGVIDNGATCPTAGDVCVNGTCVPKCTSGEFKCSTGQCDSATGLCVDPTCIGVTCPSNQVCYAGTCGAPCEGVTCPSGQTCEGDACVDLCNGVVCSAGQTCQEGLCLAGCATCGGISCAAPLACDATSGECVDPSCPNGCGIGTVCQSGACVDACTGVTCPHGQTCTAGNCVTEVPDAGPGLVGTSGPNGVNGSGADGGANGEQPDYPNVTSQACACRMQPSRAAEDMAGAFFAALAIGGAIARRRRI